MGKNKASRGRGGAGMMQQRNMPPQMRGPCPDEHQGNMPPWMRGQFPDEMWGPERNMPPWMRDQCPDGMWGPEGNMPPWMRDQCPDGMYECGGPFPPWRRGPFPGERYEGPMPPDMGGPFPGERCGGPMPPDMGGPFPRERCGGPMPPDMRGPFPRERCGGPMSPDMGGPFPGGRGGGPMPPDRRDPMPGEWGGGPMPPDRRDPFPGERCEPGGNVPPWMRGSSPDSMFEERGNTLPQMRGPFPNEMCEPRRNVPSETGIQNPPGPQHCAPLHKAGEDALRRQSLSPAGRCVTVIKCGPPHWGKDSFPSGNCSSDQLASGKAGECAKGAQDHYLQEGATRILESFGLTHEDLEELSSYPEDQLKPENMPEILETIRRRKAARQLPGLPFKESAEGDGLYSPSGGSVGSAQPTAALLGSSVPQPVMPPDSPMSRKMSGLPTPSMMNDYYGAPPRLFPHMCILCKVECTSPKDWLLHLSTTIHSESCDKLREQYPDWIPGDPTFKKSCESDRNTNRVQRQRSFSASPERSVSSYTRRHSRSRSRSPRDRRGSSQRSRSPNNTRLSPTYSRSSRESAAQGVAVGQPRIKSEDHGVLPKDQGPQEQQKAEPQQLQLSSLVEKSVSQAISLLQPAGGLGGGLPQGVSLPPLLPAQLDTGVVSLGLVSMMQMVATQVVQAVLANKEASSGQASSEAASASPQPSSSRSRMETQENKQEVVPRPISSPAGLSIQREPKRVLICGHNIIVQASQRAEYTEMGSQLGLGSMAKIEWLGQPDMSWHELLPTFGTYLQSHSPPDILVVHLGENDLTKPFISIIKTMRNDLDCIRQRVPETGIIWSSMLPRRVWENMQDPTYMNKLCYKTNRSMRKCAKAAGGGSILHINISFDVYQEDGVHLTGPGYDIFLKNLQKGLMEYITARWG